MLNNMTRTYKVEGVDANRADVSIYYDKGGMNYWNCQVEPRGYYFKINYYKQKTEGAFLVKTFGVGMRPQGMRAIVLPCERQSKRRFESACSQIDEYIEQFFAKSLEDNDLKLASDEYTETVSERRL